MPRRPQFCYLTTTLLVAVCLAGTAPAGGEEGTITDAPTLDGWTVSIDSKSREPRPPNEQELAKLRVELEAMLEDMPAIFGKSAVTGEHPMGGSYFVPPAHLQDMIFVRAGADGGYHTVCSEPERLPEILATPAPPSGAPLR